MGNKKVMMQKNAVLLLFILGLLVVLSIDLFKKNEKGFCFAQWRYVSDDELVDVVAKTLINELDKHYKSLSDKEKNSVIRYDGLQDFYSLNPFCCDYIRRENHDFSWLKEGDWPAVRWELGGNKFYITSIAYLHSNNPNLYKSTHAQIDVCGDIKTFGFHRVSITHDPTIAPWHKKNHYDRFKTKNEENLKKLIDHHKNQPGFKDDN